jgi:hypothetical protein
MPTTPINLTPAQRRSVEKFKQFLNQDSTVLLNGADFSKQDVSFILGGDGQLLAVTRLYHRHGEHRSVDFTVFWDMSGTCVSAEYKNGITPAGLDLIGFRLVSFAGSASYILGLSGAKKQAKVSPAPTPPTHPQT